MATVRPFPALRPTSALAERVACLPYDVMNHAEARAMAAGNPVSFLRICRSDIEWEGDEAIHEQQTYDKARENLLAFEKEGILVRDASPQYYIYRQMMKGRVQTGIVACVSVDEYLNNEIKKHELTRKEKELDRICHFETTGAQTEPIFLAYKERPALTHCMNEWIKFHEPTYEFDSQDGITHILWIVDNKEVIAFIRKQFESVENLYIADGHHRTASGAETCLARRAANPYFTGKEEYNFLMAVLFSDEDLFIMDYNRVVANLNGMSATEFLEALQVSFDVSTWDKAEPFRPLEKHVFGLYLENRWYVLRAKVGSFPAEDPIASLDCSILQENVLAPLLGIADPRTDKRIDFVGGIRGLQELERRCDAASGDMTLAFSLYPVTMQDLFSVADAGKIMPPKSTWFEPKLRSGLFVHTFDYSC